MRDVEIYLVVFVIILTMLCWPNSVEMFYVRPFNVSQAPNIPPLNQDQTGEVHNQFANLITKVNSTAIGLASNGSLTTRAALSDLFMVVLNTLYPGKYSIVSIQTPSSPNGIPAGTLANGKLSTLMLNGVVIKDNVSQQTITCSSIVFEINDKFPTQVDKITITPSGTFSIIPVVKAIDSLDDISMFKIQNPAHLFYPWKTSDDSMTLNLEHPTQFNAALSEMKINVAEDVENEKTYDEVVVYPGT